MAADPTLDLDLAAITDESRRLAATIKPGSAAMGRDRGGQRRGRRHGRLPARDGRHQGAGARSGPDDRPPTEYRTMEWPYASLRPVPPAARRARPSASPSTTSSTGPYANNPAFAKYKKLTSYAGNTFTRNWVVNEKEHPTTGTPYSWVRARVLGGKTNFWGRGALRYGPLQFKAASRDGYDVDWPITYEDVKPYYDKVDVLLGCSGTTEGLVAGAGRRLPAAARSSTAWRSSSSAPSRRWAATTFPGRAGVTTDGVLNTKYRTRCMGRGRCGRGCDIGAAFHSPTALIYPARDTGNLTVRPYSVVSEVLSRRGHRPRGGGARDRRQHARGDGLQGAGGRAGRGHPGQHAHPAQLEVGAPSQGMGNSSGLLGCYLSEHADGHPRQRLHPQRASAPKPPSTTGGRWRPTCRASATSPTSIPTSSAATTSRAAAGRASIPDMAHEMPGYGKAFKSSRPQVLPGHDQPGRLRRSAAAQGEPRHARSGGEGRLGHPRAAVRLPLRRQRAEDGQGHGASARGDADGGRGRGHQDDDASRCPRAGRSTRSARPAWATIRRRR